VSAHAATPAPAEPEKPSPSGRLLLRMPRTLHAELARRAETEGTSLNQYITDALARSVGWGRAPEAEEDARASSRGVVLALVANAVVIGLAAVAAVAVLVVALLG
jgi:hypothetical protein